MKCSISLTEIPQFLALFNILPHVRTTCSLNTLSDTVKPLSADSCGESEHLGKKRLEAQGSGMPVDRKSRQVIPLAPWGLIFKNIWKISKDYCEVSGPLKQLLLPSWEADIPVNVLGKRGGEYYSSPGPLSQPCCQQSNLAPCSSCCRSHLHQHWRLWGDVDAIQIQSNLAKQASSPHQVTAQAHSVASWKLVPAAARSREHAGTGGMAPGSKVMALRDSGWATLSCSHGTIPVLTHVHAHTDVLGSQDGLTNLSHGRYSCFHAALPAAPGQSHHPPGHGWQQQAGTDQPPLPLPNQTPAQTWSLPCCCKNVECVKIILSQYILLCKVFVYFQA